MNTKIKIVITLITGIYFFTGCDNGTATTTEKGTDSTKMSNTKTDTVNNKMDDMKKNDNGLTSAMSNMMDKMISMKMSGDFDMDFANMMIEHHQGAIDMSEEEIKSGTDEGLKTIAKKIITNQTNEQTKLRDIIKNSRPVKMDMGKHDDLNKDMNDMKANMTGMQMTGNTDKDFAMMMIAHHEGALKMFKDELSHGMNTQLKQMAQKGISDQTKEISEFKNWMSK